MLRQIKYFQAVVRNNSFSEAAEECYISQSAISQQIQALEREIGFKLLERKHRKFSLTSAGEHFYKRSLELLAVYEQMCQESRELVKAEQMVLTIGYLRSYSGNEFRLALEEFSRKCSGISVKIKYGNHEELYELLQNGVADLVMGDQRRAFSDRYANLLLAVRQDYIDISSYSPIAKLPSVTIQDLKNIPCILVASKEQRTIEQKYYEMTYHFQGEFLYAENLEEARLLMIGKQGFIPVEGAKQPGHFGSSISRIPLFCNEEPVTRNYCVCWKKENSGYYVEEFAKMLKQKFE